MFKHDLLKKSYSETMVTLLQSQQQLEHQSNDIKGQARGLVKFFRRLKRIGSPEVQKEVADFEMDSLKDCLLVKSVSDAAGDAPDVAPGDEADADASDGSRKRKCN